MTPLGRPGPDFRPKYQFYMIFYDFSMPENRKMTKNIKIEKNQVEKNLKNRKSWKKRTRGNCEAEAFQCQQKTFKKP